MDIEISGLYAGQVQPMPDDGRPTAIFKQPVHGPVHVHRLGLAGDAQADLRVHGGPDKALHHFPAENHALLATAFPVAAVGLVAGGLGENISTVGLDEQNVCVGDVYALGTARVQLCQPRTPCWKIEARHGVAGMTAHIHEHGIAGWYYRVLEEGSVAVGDRLQLLERAAHAPTLRTFWDVVLAHRPKVEAVQSLRQVPGLAENWQRKLAARIEWLQRN